MWEERQSDLSTKRTPSTLRGQKIHLVAVMSADALKEDTIVDNLLSIMTGVILQMGWVRPG